MNPVIILMMQVEDSNYDINASPDKREIFLKNEKEVLVHLKAHLESFFEDIQRVKAYEGPKKSTNMDLLDSFKKMESPNVPKKIAGASEEPSAAWTSKKRTIE